MYKILFNEALKTKLQYLNNSIILGTYSNATEVTDESLCAECLGGMYCDVPGLPEPAATCTPGYYCPIGSTKPNSIVTGCPVGFYCPGDSPEPLPCDDGFYVS